MKRKLHPSVVFLIFSLSSTFTFAQSLLKGSVIDEKNIPIPFAQIFVKNNADLRTTADANGYYEMRLYPGEYFLVLTAIGYEDRESYISIGDYSVQRITQLFPLEVSNMEDVEISVKKSNPGREIMLRVVEKRDSINPWNYPHSCEGYIKATEKINFKPKTEKELAREKKKGAKKKTELLAEDEEDPFAEERKIQNELAKNMNLIEVQFSRNFQPHNKVKEIRNAFEERGVTRNLYYTTTVKSNFNFFENLLHLDDLHQSPVSSPISGPGILSYRYRLVEQFEENGQKIHKIKIIPRSTATSTLEGYIWVIDSLWLVQKLELTMSKGNLLVYDFFKIEQNYTAQGDTLCVLSDQILTYGVKYKDQTSECSTVAKFNHYNFQPHFSDKFFNKELSITEKEAYDKDTSYWNKTRGVQLTKEEQAYVIAKDSIRDHHNRKEYLDSVDAIFNKITPLKVLWFGVDHRNRPRKVQWTISSLAALSRPIYIAGPRIAPTFNYFKKWENQRLIESYTEMSIGILNKDLKGRTHWQYLYDPFHFGSFTLSFVHDFDAIRSYDAISQVYKRSNFIEATKLRLNTSNEIFNGFYIDTEFEFSERRNLANYSFLDFFDKSLPNDEPTVFQPYQACIGILEISYVPGQQYMREPNRKVLLGSRWPTFYASYERGIPTIFGSDVNHEYGLLGMRQTFKIGTLGTSSYHIKIGQFLSTKSLKDADFKYNRRSDPFWFSNPLYSFQGLTVALPSRQFFAEGHLVHHDNGAILNKLPFMKKTGIGLVLGCGALYVKEFNWQHYELFTGLERNFKFSKRKLRVGLYGVVSDGNHINPSTTWKISLAVLDLRNLKWNF
jgi:hypothetical protein